MFDNKKKWQFENFKICSGSTSGNRTVPPLALVNWKKGHVFSRVGVCRSVSHLQIVYQGIILKIAIDCQMTSSSVYNKS